MDQNHERGGEILSAAVAVLLASMLLHCLHFAVRRHHQDGEHEYDHDGPVHIDTHAYMAARHAAGGHHERTWSR